MRREAWGTGLSHLQLRRSGREKQKLGYCGFTECWAVANVGRLDMAQVRSASSFTGCVDSLAALSLRTGEIRGCLLSHVIADSDGWSSYTPCT
ncbi:MAG TPA: hypothetical protein ACQGQJ_11420 [Xylella fastidiosa subsp. multiplex]